jgi:hypothetical protein
MNAKPKDVSDMPQLAAAGSFDSPNCGARSMSDIRSRFVARTSVIERFKANMLHEQGVCQFLAEIENALFNRRLLYDRSLGQGEGQRLALSAESRSESPQFDGQPVDQ